MEYGKIINLLGSESKIYLNLLLENMLELIVYLIRAMKINQLDLKRLCYDRTYVIMWMLIF